MCGRCRAVGVRMGQIEVYEWLKERQEMNDFRYFTAKDVMKGLKDKGISNGALIGVTHDLNQLWRFGTVEVTGYDEKRPFMNFTRKYRLKPLSASKKL